MLRSACLSADFVGWGQGRRAADAAGFPHPPAKPSLRPIPHTSRKLAHTGAALPMNDGWFPRSRVERLHVADGAAYTPILGTFPSASSGMSGWCLSADIQLLGDHDPRQAALGPIRRLPPSLDRVALMRVGQTQDASISGFLRHRGGTLASPALWDQAQARTLSRGLHTPSCFPLDAGHASHSLTHTRSRHVT
jgi:hypothetical protein